MDMATRLLRLGPLSEKTCCVFPASTLGGPERVLSVRAVCSCPWTEGLLFVVTAACE